MNKKILEKAKKNLNEIQEGMRVQDTLSFTELEKIIEIVGIEVKKMCQRSDFKADLTYEYANGSLFSPPRAYIKIQFDKDGEVKEFKIKKKKCFKLITLIRIVNPKQFKRKEKTKILYGEGLLSFYRNKLICGVNKILNIAKI